jgi:hypothetical protein
MAKTLISFVVFYETSMEFNLYTIELERKILTFISVMQNNIFLDIHLNTKSLQESLPPNNKNNKIHVNLHQIQKLILLH